jgi:hypothetical protein
MPAGHERRPDRVRVRYRRADGEFTETTLDCVVPEDVVAGLPVREFRWYREDYSKPHVIAKKKSPRAASNASR